MKRNFIALAAAIFPALMQASEADLKMPAGFSADPQTSVLYWGFLVVLLGLAFGCYQFVKVRRLHAHQSMLDIGNVIFKTCSTYLRQQGKFLGILFIFIGLAVVLYFGVLEKMPAGSVLLILAWTVIGVLGSYAVAWYGVRMNTYANARMAFASLRRKPLQLLNIPLDAGMSIGILLICVELVLMLSILLFMPGDLAGMCFIGFAIGESLGASALRIAGGIFTKIADIGSDLMKVVFKIGEDDPRNPGVIADCTGDNAGDSIGPTADGFETYGVTGVALVSFVLLAVPAEYQVVLLVWIFVMRILGLITSVLSYYINHGVSSAKYSNADDIDFEKPLSTLVWITSILSIIATFLASYFLLKDMGGNLWLGLSLIISCGTLGAALIPEITKKFTSPTCSHVQEVVNTSHQGSASLNILSGLVSGNFGAFWTGFVFFMLMLLAYVFSNQFGMMETIFGDYHSIFAFGLVAFGMLGMGPVTIAVDSYGPVTDNAQSVYELSLIEDDKEKTTREVEEQFGFTPDFEKAKHYLEANDGAGNTFKATAKPVLIGTAVAGATTMIFSLILLIKQALGIDPASVLNLLNPYAILGFILGGCVIFWFTGASMQAVTTGAHRAVEYIKGNIKLDANAPKRADTKKSQEVVQICTTYAQRGMINIFVAIFCFALGFACISSPSGIGGNDAVCLFVSYLLSIAIFGLFQAVFMADAGGAWDNAKKIVEVDLDAKGTDLHDATVVGDTVGDPYKDTSSVALNPIIKFTTLFGVLAMEIALSDSFGGVAPWVGVVFIVVALFFCWRSFYGMRSSKKLLSHEEAIR